MTPPRDYTAPQSLQDERGRMKIEGTINTLSFCWVQVAISSRKKKIVSCCLHQTVKSSTSDIFLSSDWSRWAKKKKKCEQKDGQEGNDRIYHQENCLEITAALTEQKWPFWPRWSVSRLGFLHRKYIFPSTFEHLNLHKPFPMQLIDSLHKLVAMAQTPQENK